MEIHGSSPVDSYIERAVSLLGMLCPLASVRKIPQFETELLRNGTGATYPSALLHCLFFSWVGMR